MQYRLSCLAKHHQIYLAVNVIDAVPCTDQLPCRRSYDHRYYNTEVVFDRRGCLVAKYHKVNLFMTEKLTLDTPPQPRLSYFDTEFGRFGLMVCFDAVFQTPAVDLVEKHNVTDIIFSTAWMNVLPHYVSVSFHSGWARTMRVNYISANKHNEPYRYVGSGVYTPDGILAYTYNQSHGMGGHLVITEVPINRRQSILWERQEVGYERLEVAVNDNSAKFYSLVFGDLFAFRPLRGLSGETSVCHRDVCCSVTFTRDSDKELFALGAFDGMHHLEGSYYLQVCLLVKCRNNKLLECGWSTKESSTIFSNFNLTGSMTTRYAFPQVVNADWDFSDVWSFKDAGYTKSVIGNSDHPLLSVVLMGRDFIRDHELDESDTPLSGGHTPGLSLWLISMTIVSWI